MPSSELDRNNATKRAYSENERVESQEGSDRSAPERLQRWTFPRSNEAQTVQGEFRDISDRELFAPALRQKYIVICTRFINAVFALPIVFNADCCVTRQHYNSLLRSGYHQTLFRRNDVRLNVNSYDPRMLYRQKLK